MATYNVSYMVVYSEEVDANSPEEAAEIVASNCPYDIDGKACVTDVETEEEWEV